MASTYLSRTPSSTGNQKTYTFSGWIKRSGLSSNNQLFGARYGDSSREAYFLLDANNKLNIFSGDYSTSATTISMQLITDRVFRDTNAWYHIVIKVDTTQATASDRVKLYINGVQETSFGTETYPDQNDIHFFNITTTQMQVGALNGGNTHDGSMTHVHFIDGTAYAASTFGETDSTTGIWKPKTAPSVTYGTNGFFLKFENSGAFGTDSSGNSNTFTVNGTMTQTIDTPSNVFCVWNDLNNNAVLSNGNTTALTSGTNLWGAAGTLGVSSGKYYWEVKASAKEAGSGNIHMIGVESDPSERDRNDQFTGATTSGYSYYGTGVYYYNNSGTSYGDTYTTGDVIGIALDLDNNKLYFAKNGTWQNSGDPTSGATGTGAISITDPASQPTGFYFPSCGDGSSSYNSTVQANFGNGFFGTTAVSSAQNPDDGIGIFEYDVPAGYRALCTKSINAEEYS